MKFNTHSQSHTESRILMETVVNLLYSIINGSFMNMNELFMIICLINSAQYSTRKNLKI